MQRSTMAPLWRPSGRLVTPSRWHVNGQRARSLVPHRAGYNDDECARAAGAGRGGVVGAVLAGVSSSSTLES